MNEQLKSAISEIYVAKSRKSILDSLREELNKEELQEAVKKELRRKIRELEAQLDGQLLPYGEILAALFERFLAGLEITIPAQTIGRGTFKTQVGSRSYNLSGSTSLAAHNATITYKENNND